MPRKRKSESYSEQINSAKLLGEGISKHLTELSEVGLDDAFVQSLDNQRGIVEGLNVTQEKLKADLKSKTDQLNKDMRTLDRMAARARKLVKIVIPSSQWKEFGIEDKK
jgi:hypothetical protein